MVLTQEVGMGEGGVRVEIQARMASIRCTKQVHKAVSPEREDEHDAHGHARIVQVLFCDWVGGGQHKDDLQ